MFKDSLYARTLTAMTLAFFANVPAFAHTNDAKIEVATSCSPSTAKSDRWQVSYAHSLINIYGTQDCVSRSSLTSLSVESIQAVKTKYQIWAVEIKLAASSLDIWSTIEKKEMYKGMVLLFGNKAVLRIRIASPIDAGKLNVFASSEAEAKLMAGALSGDDK